MPLPRNPYNVWRKAVFDRDGRACTKCGSVHRLHADHIKPFSQFPDLRYEVSNGRVLCFECHKQTDTYGGKQHKGRRRTEVSYGSR